MHPDPDLVRPSSVNTWPAAGLTGSPNVKTVPYCFCTVSTDLEQIGANATLGAGVYYGVMAGISGEIVLPVVVKN